MTSPSGTSPIDAGVRWSLQHWLPIVNGLAITYAALPWLSPLLKASGHPFLGQLLFLAYRPLCHQLPERSFFVCGHQVAFCHRCTAIYTGLAVVGLLFALLRRRIRPAPLRVAVLLTLPLAVDGTTHLIDDILQIGFRGGGDDIGSLNFWLRMITGVLFALAALVVLYPRLERDLRPLGAGG